MTAHRLTYPKTLIAILTLAALAAVPLAFSTSASARHAAAVSPAKAPAIIATNGTAKVYRTPDYLDVNVGIVVSDSKAGEAQAKASAVMEKSLDAVKALSLKGLKLQTGDVRLSPQYEDRSNVPYEMRPIIGYVASITVRVRTDDVKAAAKIIDAALGAGSNRIESVEFGIHAALEAREEAIRLAASAAKRKAQVLAESLDVRATRLVNVSSTASMYGGWYGGANQMAQNVAVRGDQGGESDGAIEPGQIAVQAEVSVTFEAE